MGKSTEEGTQYGGWVVWWLVAILALGCSPAGGAEIQKRTPDPGGEKGTVALLFPSGGCPCRYAPLAQALRAQEKGLSGRLAAYLASPPPPPGSESVGLPYRWNGQTEALRKRFALEEEDLPFLVVVGAGRNPRLMVASRVPLAPSDQQNLAQVVRALAVEEGEP